MINRGSQLRISLPAHPPSARSRTLMALSPTPTAVAAPPPEPGPEPAPSAELPLPDAIAAALPPDPYEQLEVARKITAVAVASRASRLELEAARLRQRLADRDRLAAELADRAAKLEQALRDADARLRSALDDNAKLAKERDSLAQTSKKLARDLAKLETFKRHLMQSLGDDNSQETVDIRTYEQSVAKANSWKDGLEKNSHPVSSLSDESVEADSVNQEVTTRPFEQKLTITHITPRLTSDPAPKLRTAATSPRRYSTAVSPKLASGATSPRLEGHMAMSPWLPSSKMSSAANSPPRGQSISGRGTRVDGKEFFRQARHRLSYEQFAAFLSNIKELNAHRQSREETLRKADEIFGAENMDLFRSFQGLLSRSLS
uniref:At4g15545-like C-terminal domain-containing protein n=1 Tax=Zea mays TaxID=4577 RepID=A0A804NCV4_MAIZE